MQSEILEPNPDARLIVYAIWFNMLPGDDVSEWDEQLLSDARVIHFWDGPREVGRFYAGQGFYPFGTVAWDIYFLYSPDASWQETPEPLESFGFTVIGQKDQLLRDIIHLFSP